MTVRPKSKDMKPGTVLQNRWGTYTLQERKDSNDGWWTDKHAGLGFADAVIDDPDYVEVVSVPDEPDTPAPYPLADGEVVCLGAEVNKHLDTHEWRNHALDDWKQRKCFSPHLPVIARPKPPRTVPVLLPEDVVREAVEDSWFKNFLAAGRDPNLIDDACREALTKLETPDGR